MGSFRGGMGYSRIHLGRRHADSRGIEAPWSIDARTTGPFKLTHYLQSARNNNRQREGINVTACLRGSLLDRRRVSVARSSPVLRAFGVLIALLLAGCGRANVIDVLLERPSPDGAVAAVLLSEGGGGAAGWTQDLIFLQPTSQRLNAEPPEESVVLALNRGEGYLLRWESDNELIIDVAYSPGSVVFSMHDAQIIGGRHIAIAYRKRVADEQPFSMPSRKCESRSATITDPPSRRVR